RRALALEAHRGELVDAVPDPELELLKRKYRADFKKAFASAVTGLTDRERTLLRLHFIEGISQQKLGPMYRVDASTVSRWITAARDKLIHATRRAMAEALRLGRSE